MYDGNSGETSALISACTAAVSGPPSGKEGAQTFAPIYFHATEADDLDTENENEAKSKNGASVSVRIAATVKFYEEERVGSDPFEFDETRTIDSALSFRVTVRNDPPKLRAGLTQNAFVQVDENFNPLTAPAENITLRLEDTYANLTTAIVTTDGKEIRFALSGGDSTYQEVDVHPPDDEELDDDEDYPTIPKKIFVLDDADPTASG